MDCFIEDVLPVILFILVVFGCIFGGAYAIDRWSCAGFADATGIETRYTGLSCYAKVGDKWVPQQYVFGNALELRGKK